MASVRTKDCFAGFELSHDRIRVAAITAGSRAEPTAHQLLRVDEILFPDADALSPNNLPSESALTALLKTALARLGVAGGQAAITLADPHVVLRYFVGTDESVRADMQEAAERTVKYVQLGLGDRIVGEHIHRMNDGRSHGLLAVSAATTLGPLSAALKQVGFRVTMIEPTLVSLARVASIAGQLNEEAGILVTLDTSGVAIGVAFNGRVLFAHRIPPRATANSESQSGDRNSDLSVVLKRVSRHYARSFGGTEDLRTVIVSGCAELTRPCEQALTDAGNFDVQHLGLGESVYSALTIRADHLQDADVHAAALGAVAGLVGPASDIVGPNLTSEPALNRRPALMAGLRALMWPTAVAFGIWGAVSLAHGQLERSLAKMRIEADYPSSVETTYRELQMQIVRSEQRAERLGQLVEHFRDHDWKRIIDTIRICVPDRVWLTRIRLADELKLTIEGAAYDEALIYEFRKYLEGAPTIEGATIVTTDEGRQGSIIVTDFMLECAVVLHPSASAESSS